MCPNLGFRSAVHDSYSTCPPAAKHDSEALRYETICVWHILAFAPRFGQDIKGETYKCLTNCVLSWSTGIILWRMKPSMFGKGSPQARILWLRPLFTKIICQPSWSSGSCPSLQIRIAIDGCLEAVAFTERSLDAWDTYWTHLLRALSPRLTPGENFVLTAHKSGQNWYVEDQILVQKITAHCA